MEPIRPDLYELADDRTGYIIANICESCGLGYFPSRTKCVGCMKGDNLKTVKLSKGAKLYTYTTVYRAPESFSVPYTVGYVDFEKEGIRIFAQLTGCKPEDLRIGMEMELIFEEMNMNEVEKRRLVYKFKPIVSQE
jgi:uncharacterized OB-fold protein